MTNDCNFHPSSSDLEYIMAVSAHLFYFIDHSQYEIKIKDLASRLSLENNQVNQEVNVRNALDDIQNYNGKILSLTNFVILLNKDTKAELKILQECIEKMIHGEKSIK